MRRVGEACSGYANIQSGIIETDVARVGELEAKQLPDKMHKAGRETIGKIPIMGAGERGARVVAERAASADQETASDFSASKVSKDSTASTGKSTIYNHLILDLDTANHSAGGHVRDAERTNSFESIWSVPKCLIHGTWKHVSPRHLHHYNIDASFRHNEENREILADDRVDAMVSRSTCKRIACKEAVA